MPADDSIRWAPDGSVALMSKLLGIRQLLAKAVCVEPLGSNGLRASGVTIGNGVAPTGIGCVPMLVGFARTRAVALDGACTKM